MSITKVPVLLALMLALELGSAGIPPAAESGAPARMSGLSGPVLEFPVASPDRLPSQELFDGWPPPSLQQEAYWLPWSEITFQRAALFGRPVLFALVVGWSAPVRDLFRETFADPVVMGLANSGYVSMMVNADRRPDIKERYHTGTWPVIAFLLPNGQPLLSQANDLGVARPITTSDVDPGTMRFLLEEGTKYWTKWAELLVRVGEEWTRREAVDRAVPGLVDEPASDQVSEWLLANADRTNGGFGIAPKFIIPGLGEFAALRAARLRIELEEHSRLTLDRLIDSPLIDRQGGGMHRMASAPGWGGIQTEKLLSGNVELIEQLVVALRLGAPDAEAEARLRAALDGTCGFVIEGLGREQGGFYLARIAGPTSEADRAAELSPALETEVDSSVDRLVLSGPNAQAGAALVRAGWMLDRPQWIRAGREALEMVLDRAYTRGRGVGHVIAPDPNPRVFLVAQADVALAFIEAYEVLGERRYLDAAQDVVDFALLNLKHRGERALRDFLPDSSQPLGLLANPRWPLRANTRLARAMLRLGYLGAGEHYREGAREILSAYTGNLRPYGVQATETGLAVEEWLREPLVVRLHGDTDSAKARQLRRAALGSPWPWTLVATEDPPAKGRPAAELHWRGSHEKVDDPAQLHEAIRRLTGMDAS